MARRALEAAAQGQPANASDIEIPRMDMAVGSTDGQSFERNRHQFDFGTPDAGAGGILDEGRDLAGDDGLLAKLDVFVLGVEQSRVETQSATEPFRPDSGFVG